MKISTKLSAIAFSILAVLSSVSCEKPAPETEDNGNTFTYEGNTYKVRSVVLYELENNMTQIWMSETAGYTTVDEIEASVGELVLTIPTGKIGNGKQSAQETNVGNLIRYDGKRNTGFYTFTCDKDESSKTLTIEFSSQQLKSNDGNAIKGAYSGPYSEYTLAELENQWAYNRQPKAITSVDYFEMEDGEPSRLVIYENEIPAIEVTLDQKKIGVPVSIGTSYQVPAGTEVYFDDGEEFKLSNSYGKILITPTKESISVSLKLTNEGGKTLAANYTGAYRFRYGNKTNRAIFDSGSEGYGYNGKFALNSLQVTETATDITFRFTPGSHAESGLVDANSVPTLKISKSLVNKGDVSIDTTPHSWEFFYHNFQVFSFDAENTERPAAYSGSVLNVECDNNGNYTVNLEVTYMMTKIVTQDKKDENGNVIMEQIPEKDENGNLVLDENDEPKMVEVPVQEQVEILVPASMDLYFSQAN